MHTIIVTLGGDVYAHVHFGPRGVRGFYRWDDCPVALDEHETRMAIWHAIAVLAPTLAA